MFVEKSTKTIEGFSGCSELRTESHSGRWTDEEHALFLEGLRLYNKNWKKLASLVKTRTCVQIRTHAQKYFGKLGKAGHESGYKEKHNKRFYDSMDNMFSKRRFLSASSNSLPNSLPNMQYNVYQMDLTGNQWIPAESPAVYRSSSFPVENINSNEIRDGLDESRRSYSFPTLSADNIQSSSYHLQSAITKSLSSPELSQTLSSHTEFVASASFKDLPPTSRAMVLGIRVEMSSTNDGDESLACSESSFNTSTSTSSTAGEHENHEENYSSIIRIPMSITDADTDNQIKTEEAYPCHIKIPSKTSGNFDSDVSHMCGLSPVTVVTDNMIKSERSAMHYLPQTDMTTQTKIANCGMEWEQKIEGSEFDSEIQTDMLSIKTENGLIHAIDASVFCDKEVFDNENGNETGMATHDGSVPVYFDEERNDFYDASLSMDSELLDGFL
mmetsp:Transcript_36047/g.36732  ORF Transcript_36047/g.36732 Transcript_36047/m.36732 type:complete len:442 (-) Transcript_36047:452-1777(-)